MLLTIILSCCVILIAFVLWNTTKPKGANKLPGPTPLPLLGNLLQIGFKPHVTFTKWAKRYGPIYGIKMGLENAVIINDYKLIKDLFNETSSSGRLGDNPVMLEFTKGPYGIVNSTGSTWEAQRRFTLRTLRNFGFAKTSMETIILDEVQIMLDWFKEKEQVRSFILGRRLFNPPIVNTLWRIVTGERCQWEEIITKPAILSAIDEFYEASMVVSSNGLFFAPALRFIAPNLLGWNRYVKSIDTVRKLFEESIERHKETFDSTELRDYIDHHLLEMWNETDSKSSFYKDKGSANLSAALFDLFFAGSETTSSSLSWTMLYLREYQNIQKILQREIDQVVGSTLPSLSNRVNMPYSQAVISEILRITSVAPCGIPHGMKSDLIFQGYHLPKGATVFANIWAVHHDPLIWGDPESFRPDRFLNEDGTKLLQNDALIPFSEGKRKCIGETLARDNLFLFVTSICQQFDILPYPDNKGKADFEPDFGLLLGPKPYNILVSSRNG